MSRWLRLTIQNVLGFALAATAAVTSTTPLPVHLDSKAVPKICCAGDRDAKSICLDEPDPKLRCAQNLANLGAT